MSRVLLSSVSLLALIAGFFSSGCGSSRDEAPAGGPVAEAEAAAEETSAESGIPGLTEAEVAAQPEVPDLPASITPTSQIEDVEAEAERLAEREASRGQLGELTAEKRRIYLVHVWGQALHQLRRGQPSHIAGLTIGEVEDQPPAPELAAMFDLRSTRSDLEHHAWIVAMEERDQGRLDGLPIDKRVIYLTWFWQKPLAERQAIRRAALERRRVRAEHEIEQARIFAEFEAGNRALERKYDRLQEIESMKHNPVLTPKQAAFLEALVEKYGED